MRKARAPVRLISLRQLGRAERMLHRLAITHHLLPSTLKARARLRLRYGYVLLLENGKPIWKNKADLALVRVRYSDINAGFICARRRWHVGHHALLCAEPSDYPASCPRAIVGGGIRTARCFTTHPG